MFGAGFMKERREQARRARAVRRPASTNVDPPHGTGGADSENEERRLDLISGLTNLGYRLDQARRAAEVCDHMPGASLEELIRAALARCGPVRGVRRIDYTTSPPIPAG